MNQKVDKCQKHHGTSAGSVAYEQDLGYLILYPQVPSCIEQPDLPAASLF